MVFLCILTAAENTECLGFSAAIFKALEVVLINIWQLNQWERIEGIGCVLIGIKIKTVNAGLSKR